MIDLDWSTNCTVLRYCGLCCTYCTATPYAVLDSVLSHFDFLRATSRSTPLLLLSTVVSNVAHSPSSSFPRALFVLPTTDVDTRMHAYRASGPCVPTHAMPTHAMPSAYNRRGCLVSSLFLIQGFAWFTPFVHLAQFCSFGLVWFGQVWYGMVWFGLVWFGLVWY